MSRNIPLFIAFRLLFNARFYYPIFAVIQLDYGLTMEQFAILNAVWAVSIVVLEVPSGAMADRIGRKRMVVLASILMVAEMAVLAFVPLGNTTLVFWAWVVNRILSGAAEASASGADEALAYDSISHDEQKTRWPKVLARLMRLSSLAFVIAMLVGAAIYDPGLVNRMLGWFGSDLAVDKSDLLRFPVYLTLVNALLAVIVSSLMKEPPLETECGGEGSLWSGILDAGRWILHRPLVCGIIFAALVHDSVLRLFTTTASEYYRLIGIPVAWFGVIGAAFSGIGIFAPKLAERLVTRRSMATNYTILGAVALIGLSGVALAIPRWGVFFVAFFGLGFSLINFFTSHYLNALVESRRRATVLSFRGLALNLGFGGISLVYGGILRGLEDGSDETTAYRESLFWLPGLFLAMMIAWRLHDWLRHGGPGYRGDQKGMSSSDS